MHAHFALWPAIVLALLTGAAQAQDVPFVENRQQFGPRQEPGVLRFCVDHRDSDWEIAQQVGAAMAEALLLRPVEVPIEDQIVTLDLDELYRVLLEDCDVHLGFKLLPQAYPPWMMLSRSYYSASYVLAVTDPSWRSLADVPAGQAISSTIGTAADLLFASYVLNQPVDRRWRRLPMSTDRAAIDAVVSGTSVAALVWAPGLWALQQSGEVPSSVRLIPTAPLPETMVGVGAAMLSDQTFLRTELDQAIGSLVADGTLQGIFDSAGFPATAGP
jgi:polar amino acid transport system substrate-binding protein